MMTGGRRAAGVVRHRFDREAMTALCAGEIPLEHVQADISSKTGSQNRGFGK